MPEARNPAVYAIGAQRGFADVLADGLLRRFGGDPMGLARATLLIPNHRAGREAFGIAGMAYGSHARDNVFNHMDANPGVLQVLTCPSLVAAVGSLLGPDWAIVPYANSTIEADAGDQHWHK